MPSKPKRKSVTAKDVFGAYSREIKNYPWLFCLVVLAAVTVQAAGFIDDEPGMQENAVEESENGSAESPSIF